MTFLVKWEIDVEDAGTPEEAARKAFVIMQRPGTSACYFDVIEKSTGDITGIDLADTPPSGPNEPVELHYRATYAPDVYNLDDGTAHWYATVRFNGEITEQKQLGVLANLRETAELYETLRLVRDCCIVDDGHDMVVTEDPHIPSELFDRICVALMNRGAPKEEEEPSEVLTLLHVQEGERVRHKRDTAATGVIDEIYTEDGIVKAAVVWDLSGCVGDGPIDDLERIPGEGK